MRYRLLVVFHHGPAMWLRNDGTVTANGDDCGEFSRSRISSVLRPTGGIAAVVYLDAYVRGAAVVTAQGWSVRVVHA